MVDWRGVKAIETRYAGVRFRSRLEARWAVFFDTAGIQWHYEPEGFELDGLRYLPDFWLPVNGYWIEVKPMAPTTLEREKATRLAEASRWPVIILHGAINPDEQADAGSPLLIGGRDNEMRPGSGVMGRWAECPICGWLAVMGWWSGAAGGLECMCDECPSATSPRLLEAYTAARSARFERGGR